MGRELKRVAKDFQWPMNTVWAGYLNPHYIKCARCENGYTAGRLWFQSIVSLIMIAGEDGRRGRLHPYLRNLNNRPSNDGPTEDLSALSSGLAGRDPSFLGHDACDRWSAEKKIIVAAGLDPQSWGICPHCHGDAIDPTVKAAYESWEPTGPQAGDGYQLWETCSEGSPISPVFESLDALCTWAESHATTFGSAKTSAAEWQRMLSEGFVTHTEGNMTFI